MPRIRLPYALLTALYCAGIFYASAQPSLPDRAPFWLDWPGSDKVAHAIMYAGLAAIVYVALLRSSVTPLRPQLLVIPVLFATGYGLSDEIHQLFVPNRSYDLLDLLADAVGATIAVVALDFGRRRIRAMMGGTPARI